MSEHKAAHTEEQQTKPRRLRPWRPTRRQVLWAVGTLVILVTLTLLVALLVVNLAAVKWEDLLSRERIEQVTLFIGIAVALTTLIVLLTIGGASLGWTGFADKTLWEWLQLLGALAIPLVLAIAGFWFTSQQEARQQRVETQRAETERELAEQRAQDEALQAYLDQMGDLLLAKDGGLRESKEGSEVRTLARARTLTALGRLKDPSRKTTVMQFLLEAKLVQKVDEKPPIIELSDADLSEADLSFASLSGADLSGADLSGANLSWVKLIEADLNGANLSGVDLGQADLIGTNLFGADLSGADLFGAFLIGADLSNANLSYVDLGSADLNGAKLKGADLTNADLTGVDGATKEQLEQAVPLFGRHSGRGVTEKQLKQAAGKPTGDFNKQWKAAFNGEQQQ